AADFVPETIVGPVLDLLLKADLHIVAAARHRTHRAKGETARVVGIDQLFADRPQIGDDAEPTERIDTLIGLARAFRHRFPADAVIAVAAGDEIAIDAVGYPILLIGDIRSVAIEIIGLDVRRLIDGRAAGRFPLVHEVVGDLGLAVDDHPFAAGEFVQVDPVFASVESDLDTVMGQADLAHALAGPRLVEHARHALFEHAGADPAQHVVLGRPFENDVLDPGIGEKLTEQQPRWTGTYDDDLGTHSVPPWMAGHWNAEAWSTMDF